MHCPQPVDDSPPEMLRFLTSLRDNLTLRMTRSPESQEDLLEALNSDDPRFCTCVQLHEMMRVSYNVSVFCFPFPFEHSFSAQAFYICLFTATILMALIGNFTVIWIVLRHRAMRTVTNYYLLNLAVADASISIMNTGFSWTYNYYYQWIFGETYCRVNNLMGITPICASVFTMIVMSIDRYWAIVHPLRRRPGRKATGAVILFVWLFAFLCGLPAFFISKLERSYFYDGSSVFEHTTCMSDDYPDDGQGLKQNLQRLYTTGLVIVQYFVPLLILACAYTRVGNVLRKEGCLGDSRHAKSMAAKRKAAFMLALVVFIFMVVWFPYNTYFVLNDYLPTADETTHMYIYINIYWLGMSSTVFNPVIYYFMNKRFRVGFRYAFRWLPWVHSNRGDYMAILSSHARPSLLPPHTANTEF